MTSAQTKSLSLALKFVSFSTGDFKSVTAESKCLIKFVSFTTWIFYSGSSHNMTPDISLLSHCVTPISPISIATANASPISVVSIGSISSPALSISDVFYVPQLSLSLLSISQLLTLVLMWYFPLPLVLCRIR